MLKVLFWTVSNDARYIQDAVTILKVQHDGIEIIDSRIDNVEWADVDVLLVVGAKQIGMSKVTQAARQLNFPEEKLLGDWIVCIPGFTLEKYRNLQRSRISIFSMNCFGGLLSHLFGLPFFSPLVNLWLSEKDYLKFLRAPRFYMEKKLIFKEINHYPIFTLGNIDVNLNHYSMSNEKNFDERKRRINWNNLFVTMYTVSEEILHEFDALPYDKKVCFVPFKSEFYSAWYIDPEINKKYQRFSDKVNRFAEADPFYYDPFDMLLYGKKTPLIDM